MLMGFFKYFRSEIMILVTFEHVFVVVMLFIRFCIHDKPHWVRVFEKRQRILAMKKIKKKCKLKHHLFQNLKRNPQSLLTPAIHGRRILQRMTTNPGLNMVLNKLKHD
jgi:hypothetical protein